MRLFHFSDDPAIARFTPRPVATPSQRPPGMDWLNGPLVWAIEADWQALYLFPRECPRILLRPTPHSTPRDLADWFPPGAARMIVHIEAAWADRLRQARICRYAMPVAGFEDLQDAGMWVARSEIVPQGMEILDDLPAALAADGVELRVLDRLTPLRGVWATSLHASGVRLRNAEGWAEAAQPSPTPGR
jgi:hypothetical protein